MPESGFQVRQPCFCISAIAFDQVAAGEGDYVVTDGARQYYFENFSIIVAEDFSAEASAGD